MPLPLSQYSPSLHLVCGHFPDTSVKDYHVVITTVNKLSFSYYYNK